MLLICRKTIEEIGFFDEQFYLYWEEVDWCWRAKKAGWKITQVPQKKFGVKVFK